MGTVSQQPKLIRYYINLNQPKDKRQVIAREIHDIDVDNKKFDDKLRRRDYIVETNKDGVPLEQLSQLKEQEFNELNNVKTKLGKLETEYQNLVQVNNQLAEQLEIERSNNETLNNKIKQLTTELATIKATEQQVNEIENKAIQDKINNITDDISNIINNSITPIENNEINNVSGAENLDKNSTTDVAIELNNNVDNKTTNNSNKTKTTNNKTTKKRRSMKKRTKTTK